MQSYEAARSMFRFLRGLAGLLIVGGLIVAVVGANAVGEASLGDPSEMAMLMGAVPGFGISTVGLISLIFTELGRASVDTAETSQQMLKVARDQLELSKQALRQGGREPEGYAGQKPGSVGDAAETQTTSRAKPSEQFAASAGRPAALETPGDDEQTPIDQAQQAERLRLTGRV